MSVTIGSCSLSSRLSSEDDNVILCEVVLTILDAILALWRFREAVGDPRVPVFHSAKFQEIGSGKGKHDASVCSGAGDAALRECFFR